MKVIVFVSLGGGQGKSTNSYMVARLLARAGHRVLAIDGNPQADLTLYLRTSVEEDEPTLLELIKGQVPALDAIYETPHKNLFIIPSDRSLSDAIPYLASSGASASILGIRLETVANEFDYAIVDLQPTPSQLSITCIGAGDILVLTAEANMKGFASAVDTLSFLEELRSIRAVKGKILGIVPFRDKWVGLNQTKKSQRGITEVIELAKEFEIELLPAIRESDQFEKVLNEGLLLDELTPAQKDLQYPFEQILHRIKEV
jgi:chromosome partitioning protein